MNDEYIGLDYETWSRTDLKTRGLHNYVTDPEFKVLIASVSWISTSTHNQGEHEDLTWDFVYNVLRRKKVRAEGSALQSFINFLDLTDPCIIMAHNVGFERAVTAQLFSDQDTLLLRKRMQDSAVDSRLLGAESKLEVASRQLTDSYKLEVGADLVQLFCVPNEFYPDGPTPELIEKHDHFEKWLKFVEYCEMDARGSRDIRLTAHSILDSLHPGLLEREAEFEWVCYQMNQNGWHVDIDLVKKMKQRAWANGIIAQRAFVNETGDQINFGSHQQLKKYLTDRGVQAKSLDKYHLPVVLERVKKRIAKLDEQLREDADLKEIKRALGRLKEAEALLETKAEIGGSTLSKLPVILDLSDSEEILRDQYMHLGAGATFRTTGVKVQMQNLAKLKEIKDVSTIYDLQHHWSNGDLAGQLRQVFTSRHPDGAIIVGDYGSVESRALAWEAQEDWKTQSYREGKDVYKVLASKFFGVDYDEVTAEQRPRGKYSELSCGYQASAKAVQEFMFRLGFTVELETSMEDVRNWRDANPAITQFWTDLDDLLKDSVRSNSGLSIKVGNGLTIKTTPFTLPSMEAQHPGSISLAVQVLLPSGEPFVTRFVHGLYFKVNKDTGRQQLCYYKPAERNTGRLWRDVNATMSAKKSKELGYEVEVLYSIYGGKLAGILTQSFCREMFYEGLVTLYELIKNIPNLKIVGQFHDEIALDWWPSEFGVTRERAEELLTMAMSYTRVEGFPLVAEIKSSYRYIK